jgi:hypothetical protein
VLLSLGMPLLGRGLDLYVALEHVEHAVLFVPAPASERASVPHSRPRFSVCRSSNVARGGGEGTIHNSGL